LSDKEQLIAEAKNLDLKKFLLAKQLLLDGKSHSNIQKKTGISKNTISSYRKNYCKKTLNLIKQSTKKPS
jgi:transposase